VITVKRAEVLFGVVIGLVAVLGIDFYPVPALVALTLLLLLGVARRAVVAVFVPAVACSVFVFLWVLAVTRCDPVLQDCSVEGPGLILFAWVATVAVVGATATLRFAARSRPR
jgi:hypothetical protein